MKQNYHAIVVDKRDLGEMDRLYTFYTRENGLMRVMARSIRKVDAKMAAQVEDFTLVHISIAKGNGNGLLAGAVAENFFSQLRQNYDGLLCVDHVRRVFVSLMHEYDPDARIFDLYVNYLLQMDDIAVCGKTVQQRKQMEWITHAFLMQFYELSGYVFDMAHCCICRTRVEYDRNGFSAYKGGIVCTDCARGQNMCIAEPDTIKALRIIYGNHLHALRKVVVHADVHRQLGRITHDIAQWIVR